MNPVKQAIADIVSSLSSATSFQPISLSVKAVDISKRTLDASDVNGSVFHSIRLQYLGASILLVPAVGSTVLVFYDFDSHCGFVAGCSKIESAEIVIGNYSAVFDRDGCRFSADSISADISTDGIVFNGGNLGGLAVVGDLARRLNLIENDINTLKSVFSAWVPVSQDGGAALSTAAAAWAASQLSLTHASDYENTKVKH